MDALLLSIVHLCLVGIVKGSHLLDSVPYYETLHYNTDNVIRQHKTARHKDGHINLAFTSHRRKFNILLKPDTHIFAPDVVIETSKGPVNYDITKAYIGYLKDEPITSYVHGIITKQGIFEGKIISKHHKDTYILEKASHHFNEPQHFHSVIYNHSSIKHEMFESNCKSQELHNNESMSLMGAANDFAGINIDNGGLGYHVDNENEDWREKYRHRTKRAIDPLKTTCELYVQADHTFYSTRYKSNEETVIEQLTQHVQAVNAIYNIIDFNKDSTADGINFVIKRMKISTDSSASDYKFKDDNIGVTKYLDLFSEYDHGAFCLGYIFTYRDFEGGTLGLAWTGDVSKAGGVCEKRSTWSGTEKSLNTGLVTVLNYGKDVPPSVSHITMAHEIGHNFGSVHDPETGTNSGSCFPGGDSGNYIMSARATSGDKPNNDKFSSCSVTSMNSVMKIKARDSEGCFKQSTGSICGNMIVEAGEQCDCGWDNECTEKCCFPQSTNQTAALLACQFRNFTTNSAVNDTTSFCSPSQGDCCSTECSFVPTSSNKVCRDVSGCMHEAICGGFSATCPNSAQKANKTVCGTGMVCFNGECSGSLCVAFGLQSCQCAPVVENNWRDKTLCQLCCKDPADANKCKSSHDLNTAPYNVTDSNVQPGSACFDYKGFCDSLLKCREVDPSGPLSTLKNLFTDAGLETIKEWFINKWYIPVSAFVGFVILMALFIKFCAVKLPSDKEQLEKKGRKKMKTNKGKRRRKEDGNRSKEGGKQEGKESHEMNMKHLNRVSPVNSTPQGWV